MRRAAAWACLVCALLLSACGGGSGRGGTDVVVTGVGPSAQLNGGDTASFVMTVSNQGSYTATDITIKNVASQISPSTVTITCTAGGGATCPATTGSTMDVSSLAPGGTLAFQISGTSILGASGNVSDTLSASVGSGDVDPSNNTASAYGAVVSNDVSVTATAPPGPLTNGPATFTMLVANAGPNDATNVSLSVSTSSNVTLSLAAISCVAIPNTGSNATPVAAVPTLQSDGTLLSTLIPATGGLECSLPVVVAQDTNGFAIVTMTASALGDSHAGNNTGTATVSATLVNDLSVVVTAPTGPLLTGNANFSAVVTNAGPSTAVNVIITNSTSASLTLSAPISCAATGGASVPVQQPDGTLLVASVPITGVLTCTIPTTVAPGTNGLVSDTVSLSTTDDPRTSNNSSQGIVQATLVNNVNVNNSPAPPAEVSGGSNQTFTMVVGNSGPSTASNVVLTNTLSSDLSYTTSAITCVAAGSAVPPPAFTISGQTATSTSPSIPVGGTLTCSVPVTVSPGANGTVTDTFSASAPYDQLNVNNTATATTVASSADLGVSQTAPATAPAGSPTNFTVSVANPRTGQSPGTANNVVITWSYTVPQGTSISVAPVSCQAVGGGICPATLGPTMNVPSMLTGSSLLFTFTATSGAGDRGNIVNTVSVTSDGDDNPSNNSAQATTKLVDPRSGTYMAFAADGQPYSLNIDFDAGSYTLSGSGTTTHSFGPDPGGSGDYVATDTSNANVRFRVAQDLIVGGNDFSDGLAPYVAARSFVNSVAQIAGSYDLATRNVTGGTAVTHAATGLISGNTLSVCQNDMAEVTSVANCDPTADTTYTLSVVNNTFLGLNYSGEVFQFYVANVGAAKVLLSAATAPDGSQQLRIGLVDSQGGLAYGNVRGPSIQPAPAPPEDWLATSLANSNPSTYSAASAIGEPTSDTNVKLSKVANIGGPFSLFKGPSNLYGGQIYVMQSSPLAIVFGSFGVGGGAASGLLEIGLP